MFLFISLIKNLRLLEHIVTYCRDIEATLIRCNNDFETWRIDSDFPKSTAMSLLQIGELARHFDDDFRAEYSGMAWNEIIGLRNIIAHEYEKVDLKITWTTLKKDIPELKKYSLYCISCIQADIAKQKISKS